MGLFFDTLFSKFTWGAQTNKFCIQFQPCNLLFILKKEFWILYRLRVISLVYKIYLHIQGKKHFLKLKNYVNKSIKIVHIGCWDYNLINFIIRSHLSSKSSYNLHKINTNLSIQNNNNSLCTINFVKLLLFEYMWLGERDVTFFIYTLETFFKEKMKR